MKRFNHPLAFAALLLALCAFGRCQLDAARADSFPRRADVLRQAQSCVGEVGWEDLESCTAMAFVHMRRAKAQGIRFRTMVMAYSSPMTATGRRRWVQHLRFDGRPPAGWPANASWRRHRAKWLRLLGHVDGVLRGSVPDPCPGAIHYGSRRLGEGSGWGRAPLECLPRSGQVFYGPAGDAS